MNSDYLQTFIFENTDIRGTLVKLDQSFNDMLINQDYSEAQKTLLAQFSVANLLMSSHLKFDGLISLQARGAKEVSLLMSECTHALAYRSIIRGEGEFNADDFQGLFAGGTLAITLEPEQGKRYQGVVPLEKESLADCLAEYFKQSEQLPSWFFITQYAGKAVGLMLQALPVQQGDAQQRDEDWRRITHFASTLSAQELAELDSEQVLYRLYHEEQVRVFDAREVVFSCSCSQERMERALLNLGEQELKEALAEQGVIETQCHFCNKHYRFDENAVLQLLQGGTTH